MSTRLLAVWLQRQRRLLFPPINLEAATDATLVERFGISESNAALMHAGSSGVIAAARKYSTNLIESHGTRGIAYVAAEQGLNPDWIEDQNVALPLVSLRNFVGSLVLRECLFPAPPPYRSVRRCGT